LKLKESGYTTWTGQKTEEINGCNQISEKAGSEKPWSDCRRAAEELVATGTEIQLHSKAACQNSKTTPLITQMHKKSAHNLLKTKNWTSSSVWISGVYEEQE